MTQGRHARHKGNWGAWDSQPSRSDERAAAAAADPDPSRRAPGPKDTRRWCKGKPGREHQPEIVRAAAGWKPAACKWTGKHDYRLLRRGDDDGSTVGWLCQHEERCSACGKILRNQWELRPAECPDYPGSAEQKAEAERQAAAETERWLATPAWHRRVITGPQGYRRKRAS